MLFGIDVSNYTAQPSDADFAALCNSEHIDGIVIALEYPDVAKFWYDLARRQRLSRIEAYGFLYDGQSRSYAAQAGGYVDTADQLPGLGRLWLDCEQTPNVPIRQLSEQELWDALDAVNVAGYASGIYTSRGYWLAAGNPQIGKYAPLWNADWGGLELTRPQGFELAEPYGGWLRASCTQYFSGHTSYGMSLDLDVWEQ